MTLAGRLPTTRWSLVARAGSHPDDPDAQQQARCSLEELCQNYWPALYGYLRRRGNSRADAEDLIQGFFAELIERGSIASADESRGRFRAFLFASLDHFVCNARRHDQTLRRGGGKHVISIEAGQINRLEQSISPLDIGNEASDPAALFDRQWALCLIDRTLQDLRDEYSEKGKSEWFECLVPTLTDDQIDREQRRKMADQLDLSATALKVAIHRLRARYRQRLLEAVGHTVEPSSDRNRERDRLFEALKKPDKFF